MGQTFESKAEVRVPKETLYVMTLPNASSTSSIGNLTYSHSSDTGITQNASKNFHSMDVSDHNFRSKAVNTLNSLPKPKCLLHLTASNVRKPDHIEPQTPLARTGSKQTVVCVRFHWTVLYVLVTVE